LVERGGDKADIPSGLVEFAGIRRRVCLACTPEARLGDYVIVHAGVAISTLDPVEAARVLSYLEEIKVTEEWDMPGAEDALRR
jgi:hydrogenase expression/formation protein HypC